MADGFRPGRWSGIGLGLMVVFVGIVQVAGISGRGGSGGARADTPGPPTVTLASTSTQTDASPATPLTGLHNGDDVTVTVTGTPIFGLEVRECTAGLDIAFNSDFVPDGGNCIPVPFDAQSDSVKTGSAAPGNVSVVVTFRVGTGTQTFDAVDIGATVTITCDESHPCALWLKEVVPTTFDAAGIAWVHYDLGFAAGGPSTSTPAATSTTTVAEATTTTTAAPQSTTTTAPTTTSTPTVGSSTTSTTSGPTTTTTTGPLTVTPASVASGESVNVATTGWKADSTITAVLGSEPVALGTLTADAAGKASKTVTIPASVPVGSHTVRLSGTGLNGSARELTAAVTVVSPTASSSTTAGTGSPLVRTGTDSRHLVGTGLGLLIAGVLLTVHAVRRQRWLGP